jgi:hypothetical protein
MMMTTALTGEKKNINMAEFVGDMILDIDERILHHLKIIQDRKMYNKFYIFRDVLTFIHYTSINFNHVFRSRKDPRSFHSHVPCDVPRGNLQPSILFDSDTISRIESVFKYFISILNDHYRKSHEILEGTTLEDIMKNDRASLTSLQIPVYNIIWTTADAVKVEKIFGSGSAEFLLGAGAPRTPRSNSPREDDLKALSAPRSDDLKALSAPRSDDLKRLPIPSDDLKRLPIPSDDLKRLPIPSDDLKSLRVPRDEDSKPIVIRLQKDEDTKISRSPRERKLSISSNVRQDGTSHYHIKGMDLETKSETSSTKNFVIDLSKLTPRTNRKNTHQRTYSTDVISLTPRKD